MHIGVDIGGSGVRAGLVSDGRLVSQVLRVDLDSRSPSDVIRAVVDVVDRIGPQPVGVGVPGFVRDGVVLGSPNLPNFDGFDLGDALAGALRRPVHVANDANVAALGAWAERGGTEDLVLLTLGTGVGGGVVIDGRPLTGAGGTGAELGHLFAGGDRPCGCGGRGCLETWCGTVGLIAACAERGLAVLDGQDLLDRADAGDEIARAVLRDAASALGRGLVTLVNLFNPDVIVISGGLTAARQALGPAQDILRARGIRPSVDRVEVVWGGRADRWAILGAAALVAGAA